MASTYSRVNRAATGGGGGGSSVTYSQSFNATSSWGAASGGYYTISIPESTHGCGDEINVQIFELDSGLYEQVFADTLTVANNGDVTIKILSSPDTRFAGKILIVA